MVKKLTLTLEESREVNKLRSLFPSEISVLVEPSKDGGFFAKINTFQGCFTEADTFSELIKSVSDAVATYLEIPKKYLKLMPSYCPPTSLAKDCGIYPNIGLSETLRLVQNCEENRG